MASTSPTAKQSVRQVIRRIAHAQEIETLFLHLVVRAQDCIYESQNWIKVENGIGITHVGAHAAEEVARLLKAKAREKRVEISALMEMKVETVHLIEDPQAVAVLKEKSA